MAKISVWQYTVPMRKHIIPWLNWVLFTLSRKKRTNTLQLFSTECSQLIKYEIHNVPMLSNATVWRAAQATWLESHWPQKAPGPRPRPNRRRMGTRTLSPSTTSVSSNNGTRPPPGGGRVPLLLDTLVVAFYHIRLFMLPLTLIWVRTIPQTVCIPRIFCQPRAIIIHRGGRVLVI